MLAHWYYTLAVLNKNCNFQSKQSFALEIYKVFLHSELKPIGEAENCIKTFSTFQFLH